MCSYKVVLGLAYRNLELIPKHLIESYSNRKYITHMMKWAENSPTLTQNPDYCR